MNNIINYKIHTFCMTPSFFVTANQLYGFYSRSQIVYDLTPSFGWLYVTTVNNFVQMKRNELANTKSV